MPLNEGGVDLRTDRRTLQRFLKVFLGAEYDPEDRDCYLQILLKHIEKIIELILIKLFLICAHWAGSTIHSKTEYWTR